MKTILTVVAAIAIGAGAALASPVEEPRQYSTAELKTLYDTAQLVTVDVRDPVSYQRGHVPGARLFKWNEIEALAADLKKQGKPVVAYCDCPAEESSKSAAAALQKAGVERLGVLVGGFVKWAAAGHPVAKGDAPPQDAAHGEPAREQWQRVGDIFTQMGVSAGGHVADIGAGGGFFTIRLAKAVGEAGRVYAVDVNPVSLRELKEALPPGTTNVELIRGDENDPRLPPDRLDAALIVNAYHEFAEHQAMLARILAALKPGGRLALVEPAPTRPTDTTRAAQGKRHAIAIEFAEEDLRQAGFEIVVRDIRFTTRPAHKHDAGPADAVAPVEWLIVARKPIGSLIPDR
jgi:rhodanese-related sulfurtransferase/predicted methyltransferase